MVKFFRHIQAGVDRIGMYRMVSSSLLLLGACSLIAGGFGWIVYSPVTQLVALLSAVVVALVLNIVIARIRHIPANHESALITALILFFLTIPEVSFLANWPLWAAITIAIISKFFIVYRRQHIFNAAALGAVALSLPGIYEMSWWAGNPVLFVPMLILGAVVVMKVRKWPLVLSFLLVGFLVFLYEEWQAMVYFNNIQYSGLFDLNILRDFFTVSFKQWTVFWLSGPSLFLAAFMLTEPFTMPPTKRVQSWYGAVVGFLSQMWIPGIKMTPELALLLGNLAVYPWRIRRKLILPLKERVEIAKHIFEYTFLKPKGFTFKAGQYLEWMLPHGRTDSRGARRYFTIASAPSEAVVRLACKHVENGSSYKQSLVQMSAGSRLIASQLAGDFTLPKNPTTKLGFIAGGIGITPFRSHIAHMLESKEQFDTALFYCVNKIDELAYADFFKAAAAKLPLQYTEVVAKEEVHPPRIKGFVTANVLLETTPDFRERLWYISGPPPMVNAYKTLLKKSGVPRRNIKTDFFPGLA